MRSSGLFARALLFSSTCAAWSTDWSGALEAARNKLELLGKRQEASSFDLSFSGAQGNTATTATSVAVSTGDTQSGTTITSGSESGTITGTPTSGGDANSNGTTTGGSSFTTTAFDPRLPPGGISMITPNALSTTYYKIMDNATFAWNYTSVSILPSAIDILAIGAVTGVGIGAAPTYTIALNQTVNGTLGSYTWDTNEYQSSASSAAGTLLRTNYYTLVIHDAAKDISAVPSAGYLDTQETFTFGMYLPSPYTAYAEWKCATCSGAMSTAEKQTVFAVLSMAGVTVLSFTWFAGVAGLL